MSTKKQVILGTIKTLGPLELVALIHAVIEANFRIIRSTGPQPNDRDPGVHELITIVWEGEE